MRIGKIKSKHVLKELRFSGGYFLNEDAVNSRLLEENADKCKPLKELANVFNPPIFKRQFCENTERAVPYCQSSDVTNALEGSDVYINKEQAIKVGAIVKDKQTLVTGFGTIGNTRLVNELSDGIAYANNVCRIEAHDESIYGFIYALMTSKYGRAQLNKNASGSVVRYIEAPGIKETLVPTLPDSKQQQIHNLIVEASKLRVEANKLLEEANDKFHSLNEIEYSNYHLSVSENKEYLGFTYRISEASKISIKAKNHSKRILEIKRKWNSKNGVLLQDYLVNDFKIGSRGSFKRIDSETIGAEMVSQGDLHRINPKNYKRVIISRKNIDDFGNENLVLFPAVGNGSSEGEILFRSTLSYKSFNDKLLSGDIGKFQCPSLKHAAYLLVALKSKGGFRMMRAFYYGTQLRRPNWELLKGINIPVKDEECFNTISSLAIEAYNLRFNADEKENKAINLIENEIEQWQES